jgi:hypothetical protein
MNFGMGFERSPRSKGSRCRHSFQPSTPISNTKTFPRQSVYLCSTTTEPKLTPANRSKPPTKKATRCDPGGPSPNARSVDSKSGDAPGATPRGVIGGIATPHRSLLRCQERMRYRRGTDEDRERATSLFRDRGSLRCSHLVARSRLSQSLSSERVATRLISLLALRQFILAIYLISRI